MHTWILFPFFDLGQMFTCWFTGWFPKDLLSVLKKNAKSTYHSSKVCSPGGQKHSLVSFRNDLVVLPWARQLFIVFSWWGLSCYKTYRLVRCVAILSKSTTSLLAKETNLNWFLIHKESVLTVPCLHVLPSQNPCLAVGSMSFDSRVKLTALLISFSSPAPHFVKADIVFCPSGTLRPRWAFRDGH